MQGKKNHDETNKSVLQLTGFTKTENELIKEIVSDTQKLIDKIENGTLIDTKVKIGQRVFRRGFFKGEIDEYIVSNIILENGELKIHLKHDFDEHKTCYSATVLDIEEIGKTIFLTKAEAEAKLKELKGVQNGKI